MSVTRTYPGELPFLKMQGLGNDFVVIDQRGQGSGTGMCSRSARALADRRLGIGCDQVAVLRDDSGRDKGHDGLVDAAVDFWNADGSPSDACGNATRCIGRLLMAENGRDVVRVRTGRGVLSVHAAGDGEYSVNMGRPRRHWSEIPLARDVDPEALPIDGTPVAVSIGNPHCVFIVDEHGLSGPEERGPEIERHPLFPERTNVEFVHVVNRNAIRVRIWERGTGVTLASGSGSCAAAVATHLRNLTERRVTVELDGGSLEIDWRDDGVWMKGPANKVYSGRLDPELLESME